jgi:hypothetical protein
MRCKFKMVMVAGFVLALVGSMNLTPIQRGESLSMAAEASEWSEGILKQVMGLSMKEGHDESNGLIEIGLRDGTILPLDPAVKIKDSQGNPISLEQFTFPSKIRFRLDKGVVKELVLIEAFPR